MPPYFPYLSFMKIVLATQNPKKRKELLELLPEHFEILNPSDVNWTLPIEETGTTLQQNALIKAKTLAEFTNLPALADDSGLLVDALNGAPGVYSARYAGENATDQDNIVKLLRALENTENRAARFETILAWVHGAEIKYFKGEVKGKIIDQPKGTNGFGYDPVFVPENKEQTFGELGSKVKKSLSHRSKALQQFLEFIETMEE